MVGGMGEDEHGGVGRFDSYEGDGGPAALFDDLLQFCGETRVGCGEFLEHLFGCAGDLLAVGEAADSLIFAAHLEKPLSEGRVGAWAVLLDEFIVPGHNRCLPGGRLICIRGRIAWGGLKAARHDRIRQSGGGDEGEEGLSKHAVFYLHTEEVVVADNPVFRALRRLVRIVGRQTVSELTTTQPETRQIV